jgi:hypothetical protein
MMVKKVIVKENIVNKVEDNKVERINKKKEEIWKVM